jgi:hypothetical protein
MEQFTMKFTPTMTEHHNIKVEVTEMFTTTKLTKTFTKTFAVAVVELRKWVDQAEAEAEVSRCFT